MNSKKIKKNKGKKQTTEGVGKTKIERKEPSAPKKKKAIGKNAIALLLVSFIFDSFMKNRHREKCVEKNQKYLSFSERQ